VKRLGEMFVAIAIAITVIVGTVTVANARLTVGSGVGVFQKERVTVLKENRPTVVPKKGAVKVGWSGLVKKRQFDRFRIILVAKGNPGWQRITHTSQHYTKFNKLHSKTIYRCIVKVPANQQKPYEKWKRLKSPTRWFQPLPKRVKVAPPTPAPAPTPTPAPIPTPAPTPTFPPPNANTVWVNPNAGNDTNTGDELNPVRTVVEAWNRIPRGQLLSQPYWIQLQPGHYPANNTPNYWEERYGSATAPIVLNAAQGPRTVVFNGDINAYDIRHTWFNGITVDRDGDTFHCEKCSHIVLQHLVLKGNGMAHETVKINQSDHITIVDSDISGAEDNAIDFVAVQHGLIARNRIHNAQDWCVYAKGGSAYIMVDSNEIYGCGTGGFTAGQGTGFEFMVAPWLQYEAYGITVVNNVIHNVDGAGLGVNGGYNIIMAHNTLYRVGSRSHTVEFVHGSRSCDGDTVRCRENNRLGGWGGASVEGQWVPSKHVAFVNNIVYNPVGMVSRWSHLQVAEPVDPPAGSNILGLSKADDDLVVRGNVFSNGGGEMFSGLRGEADSVFGAENWVNTVVGPILVDPEAGKFGLLPDGLVAGFRSTMVPAQPWDDVGLGVPGVALPPFDTNRPPGAREL